MHPADLQRRLYWASDMWLEHLSCKSILFCIQDDCGFAFICWYDGYSDVPDYLLEGLRLFQFQATGRKSGIC